MSKVLGFPQTMEQLTDVQLYAATKKALSLGDEVRISACLEECKRRKKLNIWTRANQFQNNVGSD